MSYYSIDQNGVLTITDPSAKYIGDSEFFKNDKITEVIIPNGVIGIGALCFCDCKNLKKISFSATIVTFPENAFLGCTNLETIVVDPENPFLKVIDGILYFDKTMLLCPAKKLTGNLEIPDFAVSLYGNALSGNLFLTSVVFHKNVINVFDGAFTACPLLSEFIVDEKNEHFTTHDGALYTKDMKKLISYPTGKSKRRIVIPEGVTEIAPYAISTDTAKEISLPSTLEKIGMFGIVSTSIEGIVIPASVKEMDKFAISIKSTLDKIECESSCAQAGWNEKWNTYSLDVIWSYGSEINDQEQTEYNTSIDTDAQIFDEDTYIVTASDVNEDEEFISINTECSTITFDSSFKEIPQIIIENGNTVLERVIIPEGVTKLLESAFLDYPNLAEVSLPKTLTEIGDFAFESCYSLSNIDIPDSVEKIGESAFEYSGLTKIKIPKRLLELERNTFSECVYLEEVIFPENSSLLVIHDGAFNSCEELKRLFLPDSLMVISSKAFTYSGIKTVFIPKSVCTIYSDAFLFTQCNIYCEVDKDKKDWSDGWHSDNDVYYSTAKKSLEPSIKNNVLKIPCGLKTVYQDQFSYLNGIDDIKEIVFEDGVTLIDNSAFKGFKSVEKVTLPKTLEDIFAEAFKDCTSIKTINIPKGVKIIGVGAFQNCLMLENAYIPEGAVAYSNAFSGCPNLTVHCDIKKPFLSSIPKGWDKSWCDKSCKIIWKK